MESQELIEISKDAGGVGERLIGVTMAITAAFLAVVVTKSVPIPAPFASVYVEGFTVQVVAFAGTVQERVTVEANPKKGVTPMSFM